MIALQELYQVAFKYELDQPVHVSQGVFYTLSSAVMLMNSLIRDGAAIAWVDTIVRVAEAKREESE